MTLPYARRAGLFLASLPLAVPALAQVEVTAKDFDDGHGGHQTAIWKDGRPYWYSDFSSQTKPALDKKTKQALKKEVDAAKANDGGDQGGGSGEAPAGEPSPRAEAASPDAPSPGASGPGGGTKADAPAPPGSAASADNQKQSAARASAGMNKMAAALKGLGSGDPGAGAAARAASAAAAPAGKPAAPAPVSATESFAAAYGSDPSALARLGLKLGTGADGRPAVMDASGRPATPAQLEALRTQNPRALERRPDFFGVIPRERYAGLVAARTSPGGASNSSFQDIGMTSGNRDFVWNRSCTKGLDSCNPLASGKDEAHYDKNAEVSPETLKKVAETEDKKAEETLSADDIGKIYAAMQETLADMDKEEARASATPGRIVHPARLTAEGLTRLVSDTDWAAAPESRPAAALASAAPAAGPGFFFSRLFRSARPQAAPLDASGAVPTEKGGRSRAPLALISLSAAAVLAAVVVRKRRPSGPKDSSTEKPA